jgi:uncharacterized membrane protein YqaE (UPF0057 family)
MKKIFTLFIATTCAAILASAAFGASIVIVPETTTPTTDVTAPTEGIFTNPESPLPDAITLKSAVDDFKNLTRAERRDRIKEAKVAFKEFKKEKREGKAEGSSNRLLEIIVTILLPPVGVLIHEGRVDSKFWIDLLLWLLFYIPGLIYGLIVVLGD